MNKEQEKQAGLGKIMHGLTDENVAPVDKVWINMPTFPQVSASRNLSMLLCSRVKDYHILDSRLYLTVEGQYVVEQYTYRYFDYRQVFSPRDNTSTMTVLLDFVRDRTVRVVMNEGFTAQERTSEMLAPLQRQAENLTVTENETELRITNGTVTAIIRKDPWKLTLSDERGVYYEQFGRDDHSYMPYEVTPFGLLFDGETDRSYASEAICATPEECFYGLGECFTDVNHRGRKYRMWNTNSLGVNTERMYKSIPVFYSSRGYGVFIHSSRAVQADMGADLTKAAHLLVEDQVLDLFIMRGTSIRDILPEYFALTGAPCIPPKWSFGLWISKISYRSREEVETVARKMRENDLPCDVIHVDTDWFAENWICDWKFEESRFPKVEEMLEKLHEDGFRLSLWQLPYVERGKISTEVYDDAMRKGYFASMPDGDVRFPHGLIDFSNPEAVDWYKHTLLKPLLEMGVDVIKVDFGESAPPFFKYADMQSEDMHNLYSLLYNKAAFEATREVKGEKDALIWARSAWAGSQQYPVHWGGDAGTDFASLATSIKGCLNASLSGIPFWSSDLGGFWFDTEPLLYLRWVQFGMFCSHARLHGFYTREPWDYGEETVRLFREAVKLRYRMLPYIYNQALRVGETQEIMHRPMCYEYPDDPNCESLSGEYLFGTELLVAPVTNPEGHVRVYFPEGVWTDLFTGERHNGMCWHTFDCPLNRFPVYLRENAILPMGPDQAYVDEKPLNELTVLLAPGVGEHSLRMYEQHIDLCLSASDNTIAFAVEGSECAMKLIFKNTAATAVTVNEGSVDFEQSGQDTIVLLPKREVKASICVVLTC